MDVEGAQPGADGLISSLAGGQHGLVSTRQLLRAGVGRGAIEHRVRAGRLIRVHRGTYAVGHVHQTRAVRWMAAVLACGDGAVLSHVAAAALWELRPSSATKTDVTVPGRAGRRARDRIVVHRSIVLPESEVTTQRAIPVTTVARTLLDCAATLQTHALHRAVERSEILELFDLTEVRRTLDRHPNHPGTKKLAAAIEIYREEEITRSDLEAILLALCDAHDLPRPLVNHIVEGEEVDFLWPDQRLVVEADGRSTHLTRQAFERDRAKDAKLTLAGYRVVRFTYRQILHASRAVAATLDALLHQERSMSSIR
jgi:very-short-patch-repair endonuclease